MATFSINIDPIPPAWYYETFDMFQHATDCNVLITSEHTVGLTQRGENVADRWIFSSIDNPYQYDNKYLKITNMYSTHPNTFYMEYNGVPIPNASFEPDNPQVVIDVQYVASGYPIPGLKFKFVDHNPDDGGSISFQVSMERVSDSVEGLWVYPRFNSQNIDCTPPPEPEIFQESGISDQCHTSGTWRVAVPPGSSRWVTITSNDQFGTTDLAEEITVDTVYQLDVFGETNGPYTTFSNVTLATRLYSTSTTIIDSIQIARAHTGTTC